MLRHGVVWHGVVYPAVGNVMTCFDIVWFACVLWCGVVTLVQVKRVESANQLAMKVASDEEDDAVDQLLEQQHQIMRSSSAYSLASNPESNGQQQVLVGLWCWLLGF